MIPLLYTLITLSLIVCLAIGTVLYKRHISDRPRRARNVMVRIQMAALAAQGVSTIQRIRAVSLLSDAVVNANIAKSSKSLYIARVVVDTQAGIASIGSSLEPPPTYRHP